MEITTKGVFEESPIDTAARVAAGAFMFQRHFGHSKEGARKYIEKAKRLGHEMSREHDPYPDED